MYKDVEARFVHMSGILVGSPNKGGLPGGGFVLVRKEPCSKIKYSGGNMVCV